MNTIVISHDPFAIDSIMHIIDNGKQESMRISSEPERLAATAVSYAHDRGIYNLKIQAAASTMDEIERLIKEYEFNIYSNNKITVERI